MKIICRDSLAVECSGWKIRKEKDLAVSSPWENPSDWVDYDTGEENDKLKSAHINDPFILVWIDRFKADYDGGKAVQMDEGYTFKVNKSATIDEVLETLEAIVYFSEGAKVSSPNICGKFTSDEYLYYTDIDGAILIDDAPYQIRGKMPEAVRARLLEMLELPPHWKTPFRFITTN